MKVNKHNNLFKQETMVCYKHGKLLPIKILQLWSFDPTWLNFSNCTNKDETRGRQLIYEAQLKTGSNQWWRSVLFLNVVINCYLQWPFLIIVIYRKCIIICNKIIFIRNFTKVPNEENAKETQISHFNQISFIPRIKQHEYSYLVFSVSQFHGKVVCFRRTLCPVSWPPAVQSCRHRWTVFLPSCPGRQISGCEH